MKKSFSFGAFTVLGLVFAGSAFAQSGKTFRLYSGSLSINGKSIPASMMVDEEIKEERFGDPEIPGHGFIRKLLEIRLSEGNAHCEREILLENGELRTCSGLRVRLGGAERLLKDKSMIGLIRLSSSDEVIGSLVLNFEGTQAGIHEGSIDE